jgi:ankyrin repeat protein
VNIQQAILNKKFQVYLAEMGRKYPSKYTPAAIKEITEELMFGHCSGFTTLWFYRKSKDQDSLFYGNLNLIAEWDETAETLSPNKEEIETYRLKLETAIKSGKLQPKEADKKLEQFKEKGSFIAQVFEQTINDIRWMQNSLDTLQTRNKGRASRTIAEAIQRQIRTPKKIRQIDMDDIIESIKEKNSVSLTKEFSMGFVFKKVELIETLKNIILEDKMVQIGSTNHVIGVIKKEGKYHIYDSNNKEGEKVFSTIEELEEEIEACHFKRFGIPVENLPININVFDWEKGDPDYRSPYSPYLAVDLISGFLQANNDINRNSHGGFTPLTLALAWDYPSIYYFLISQGADLNQRNPKGLTPIMQAVKSENIELLKLLCSQKGINLNQDLKGWTSLMFAASIGNTKALAVLLSQPGIDLNVTGPEGITALGLAVFHQHIEAVKMLISQPNIYVDYKTITAVKNSETVKLITNHLRKEFKNYPLNRQEALWQSAFKAGDTKFLGLLLSTAPNLLQYSTNTKMEILLLLVNHHLQKKSMSAFAQYFQNNPFMDLNVKNSTGATAIGLAAQRNLIPIVNILISFPNVYLDYDTLKAPVSKDISDIYQNHLKKHFKDYPLPHRIGLFQAAFSKNDTAFINSLLSLETQYISYPQNMKIKIAMALLDFCAQKDNYADIKQFFRKYPKTLKACLPDLEQFLHKATRDKNKSLLNLLLTDLKVHKLDKTDKVDKMKDGMQDTGIENPRRSKKPRAK